MKQQVILSKYSLIVTIVSNVLLIGLMFYNNPPANVRIMLAVMWGILVFASLLYMPTSISADKNAIYIKRCLRVKAIHVPDILSVKMCAPTMGAIRICASGGFFGYWGWFKERDLGKYFAYYGRSSDCFLVELKDGRKYMLGCKNPQKMVEYINGNLKKY
jgi:hypothetical protein